MKIGILDTPVRFEEKVSAENSDFGGEDTVSWVKHIECFVDLTDITTRMQEDTKSDLRQLTRPCRIRCRYIPTINSDMRVVVLDRSDRILQIVSKPAEIGRKEGLEMMCQEYGL